MIITELTGGFGNQLFQYAAGLSLSMHHKVPLKVNPLAFNKPDPTTGSVRFFDLQNLSDPPEVANLGEIDSFCKLSAAKKLAEKIMPFHKRSVYKEKGAGFDSDFFNAAREVYIKGNRQSEKYFKPYEEEVRQKLRLSNKVIANVEHYGNNFRRQDTVALHIRRGDYLTQVALEWLGLLPLEYYQRALTTLCEKVDLKQAVVFSDDIEWVKQHLLLEIETIYASGSISHSSMEDFYLMSCCRHQVIANSTFSWWAAYLNEYPEKRIVAPNKWYNKTDINDKDLVPSEWIRL